MIFDLFKSKPTLDELIPNGFVDIHSHILPGIDDGAKNIDDSIKLISEMKKLGFSKIIGTPHTYTGLFNNTHESIENAYNKLEQNLQCDIEISYASEYLLDNNIVKNAKSKNLLCLMNNFVLVEMSYLSSPLNLYDIIFEIKVNGYTPVLAHPERYVFLFKNFKEYSKLKKTGCKFQLNLLSITGYYGRSVLENSEKLLKNNLIDYVGSDIHNMKHINQFKNKVKINEIEKFNKAIEANFSFR